jgi:hypothetical protein
VKGKETGKGIGKAKGKVTGKGTGKAKAKGREREYKSAEFKIAWQTDTFGKSA